MRNSQYPTGTEQALNPEPLPSESSHDVPAIARGFAAVFGLHPAIALTAIAADCMVSAVDVATLGISLPVLWLLSSLVIGVLVFLGQKNWMNDDAMSAFIKSLSVSFLFALPTPLPSFLTVPSAIAGAVQLMRRGKE